jgi:pimeloyl-ACP methyl ester carboxylesterase
MVHSLCMNDLQWTRQCHNHGDALAADLGWTPVYLHYNSGLHVSTNGHAFAALLEALVDQWPMPVSELAIMGHSVGGLVAAVPTITAPRPATAGRNTCDASSSLAHRTKAPRSSVLATGLTPSST